MKIKLKNITILFLIGLTFIAYSASVGNAQRLTDSTRIMTQNFAEDIHSYSNPKEVRVRHVDLDWMVLFDKKILQGTATLTVERAANAQNAPLILDTRDLRIEKTEASSDGKIFTQTEFQLGAADKILGAPLTVQLPANAKSVRVSYSTSPAASGLQWLEPSQTAGKKRSFMFSQAQAIHARSFIPLQDSPQVRVTYSARVRTPKNLLAVMSAEGNSQNNNARNGDYRFHMTKPIPSYLIAIAVGDLQFRSLGKRTGVYTEPAMIEKAAFELADTEKMVEATEKLYGAYRWGRYDILVLPPSFPFGGMENPMLTFATPTILAGDKSLVSLVAHELAHSWSGNLVTNATWRDFWLNEGFTTYLERRIIEAVYGQPRREMEATLGRNSLEEEMASMATRDQILHVDLKGRDPDEGFTGVPYEKGALFLRYLEETFGREKFDNFVRGYFDSHAFQSITTANFVDYLNRNLITANPQMAKRVSIEDWIYQPGLPANAPQPASEVFVKIEVQAKNYTSGKTAANKIQTRPWTTQEWLHFLKSLPQDLGVKRMAELDRAFNLTNRGNSEIAFQWLMMSIKNNYAVAYPRLEEFLTTIGRRKFVRPLFAELAKTPEGTKRAVAIYTKARSGYHPITQASVDEILKWKNQ
ncbi:MAG: M1 family metallopeptidase [Acidobacteria bacterium]|nr:M1 family metallopeptidase [Acidobacteriota bacterium]MCA1639972.1 M1 family metallopeptidase [Acidobacteriota bacterium]